MLGRGASAARRGLNVTAGRRWLSAEATAEAKPGRLDKLKRVKSNMAHVSWATLAVVLGFQVYYHDQRRKTAVAEKDSLAQRIQALRKEATSATFLKTTTAALGAEGKEPVLKGLLEQLILDGLPSAEDVESLMCEYEGTHARYKDRRCGAESIASTNDRFPSCPLAV